MNKTEKSETVEAIKLRFKAAAITLLTDYTGLPVKDITQLRQELRKNNCEMKVMKNTLAVRALEDSEMAPLSEYFKGTTAVVTTDKDPVAPARILVKLAKDMEKLQIRAGFLSGKILSRQEIEALSKLPSREELLAKILGSMMAPAQNLYNVMVAIPRQLMTVLSAVRDKKAA